VFGGKYIVGYGRNEENVGHVWTDNGVRRPIHHKCFKLPFSKSSRFDTCRSVRFAPSTSQHGSGDNEARVGIMEACPDASCRFSIAHPYTMSDDRVQNLWETKFYAECNDFSFAPNATLNDLGKVAFASNTAPPRSQNPFVLDVEREAIIDTARLCRNRCLQSEITSVGHRDCGTTLLYGHRNGTLSVVDPRSGSCQSSNSLPRGQKDDPFGSITSVLPIDAGGNMIYSRGSFGSSMIYDVRRLGGALTSLLHHLTVPTSERVDRMRTTGSYGAAFDPMRTTTFSPYVDGHGTCRVGMWSLQTGKFVGSYPIDQGGRSRRTSRFPWVEISDRITDAWRLERVDPLDQDPLNQENCGDPGCEFAVRRDSSCWSLWFKCGYYKDESMPRSIGGINQLCFPGSIN